MRMLTAASNALHRLCHECNVKPVKPEYISYYVFYLFFIVRSLQRIRIFPVDFKLLHYVIVMSGVSHLGFDAADLLVTHFHFKTVAVKNVKCSFESCTNRPHCPLPVLLLELLRCGKLLSVRLLIRCFNPEFQFCRRCHYQILNLIGAV